MFLWKCRRFSDRKCLNLRLRDWDWDKFIQHQLSCMSDIMHLYNVMLCWTEHDIIQMHDIRHTWQFLCIIHTNLISNTSLHVGRPLLRPFLVAYAEATLARQKKIAQQTKSDDIISEYLLRMNGQLFEINVKIVSSYWQAEKAFDPLQHD